MPGRALRSNGGPGFLLGEGYRVQRDRLGPVRRRQKARIATRPGRVDADITFGIEAHRADHVRFQLDDATVAMAERTAQPARPVRGA